MNQKEKINFYSFVDLPDPKVRYLICGDDKDLIAVAWFADDGTSTIEYKKPVSPDLEIYILTSINERRRYFYGW